MSSNIDRRWMYEMTNSQGLLNLDWCNLVETEFLDFAFSQTRDVRKRTVDGKQILRIRCPCSKCKLKPHLTREEVKYHVCTNGFVADYKTWLSHGETKDTSQCSNPSRDDDPNFGCRQMVLDNIYASFPLINASNVFEQQNPSKSAQEFYDMLEADNEPLYEGCQNWSKLQAATSLLNWKSECNVPDSTFDKLVPFIKSWLPADNKLVENFYETKKALKKLRLPKKKIHACINHCMLFDGVNSSLTHCRVCKASRYKSGGRKEPHLVLTYMPIAPRLQKMYMSKKIAKDMTWHANHQSEDGSMVHPSDGKAWKHFDSTNPFFAEEIRNVRLGLCTDGFSPNSSSSNPYSCWPVFLSIYNLPPWMALKESYVKLALIIPGKKSPGQNIDVFLRPLIEELKTLYDDGVDTYDAYRKTNFTLRAILLWTVSDFPAYAMLSGWSTHGKLACPYCMDKADSFQLRNGGKSCWFDCHRIFLPRNHSFRRDKKGFRALKTVGSLTPPPELTGLQIWEQICNYPTVYEGEPYNPKNKKILGFGSKHNWVKRSIFWELPYWHLLLIRHNLDVMHIEKNVFENLFNTIMGTSKTKDNIKARKDVEIYCDRPNLHIWSENNKIMKPKASYTLTKPQVKKVCEWVKQVKFPDGYASNIGACVNLKDCSFYSFKSHECHVFMQRLLPIALKGMIPNAIWDVITELCTFFRAICSKVLHVEDLEKLRESIVVTICKLEKVFPPGFFDSMEHLVIHLANEAIRGGPVQYRWMYIYERKLGSLKRTVRNKAKVEGSICESYLIHELSTQCSLYLDPTIETRLNRDPRNYAPDVSSSSSTDSKLSIFKVPSRRLYNKKGRDVILTHSERHKAHTYVLLNCKEVQPFISLFDSWVRETSPHVDANSLSTAREHKFAKWFKEHVFGRLNGNYEHLKGLARGPLRNVKSYEGYFVNGYKFHTKKHGIGRVTHNSGVCVRGSYSADSETDYYGSLDEVLELDYHSDNGRCIVVLFKCSWFDPFHGVKLDRKHNLVDIKHKSKGCG